MFSELLHLCRAPSSMDLVRHDRTEASWGSEFSQANNTSKLMQRKQNGYENICTPHNKNISVIFAIDPTF